MPARLEFGELASRRRDACGARRVGEGNHAIGVADIERVAQQRHAERLIEPGEEDLPGFGHAVAVGVAQQRDAVRAHAHGAGAPPIAGSGAPPCSRRQATVAPPISATISAKMPDMLIALLPRLRSPDYRIAVDASAFTSLRQSCCSLNPSTSRALRLDSGAS